MGGQRLSVRFLDLGLCFLVCRRGQMEVVGVAVVMVTA